MIIVHFHIWSVYEILHGGVHKLNRVISNDDERDKRGESSKSELMVIEEKTLLLGSGYLRRGSPFLGGGAHATPPALKEENTAPAIESI